MNTAADLAKQSDSTIIVLFVVLAIIIIALIPVMKVVASIKRSDKKLDQEHENRLIQVIEKNTEVNTALKLIIEGGQKHCTECKKEQMVLFGGINKQLSEISIKLGGEKND
jgi:predicted PurR-regulated permease PerM